MALVVFLRGVNVGRHKRFLPAQLAKNLVEFDVVNIGAAGTFVVRSPAAQSAIRAAIGKQLAFDAEIVIVTGRELLAFVSTEPFGRQPAASNEQRLVTVLVERRHRTPPLPLTIPPSAKWQVKIVSRAGPFVASVWRRQPGPLIYPNVAIEKLAGPATTRNWNTIRAICKILQP
jgi:uncharacterized protein (DUF1697 family)